MALVVVVGVVGARGGVVVVVVLVVVERWRVVRVGGSCINRAALVMSREGKR